MTMQGLIERIQDWLGRRVERVFPSNNKGVAEAREAIAMLCSIQKELEELRASRDRAAGWEAVVHDCEKLLGREGVSEEPWQSTLFPLIKSKLGVEDRADLGE